MWTAASGISENGPYLAGCKTFWCVAELTVSQYLGIEPIHWEAVFNWSFINEHPVNVLTLMAQCKW